MRSALVSILFGLAVSGDAIAGAWLREPGTVFLSFGGSLGRSDTGTTSETRAYSEFGWKPNITAGLDINETPSTAGHAIGFLRFPLTPSDADHKLAFEIGIGGSHVQQSWSAMSKLTLSWGRGFNSAAGDGWIALDSSVELRQPLSRPIYKLDATVGLSTGPKLRPLLKVETGDVEGAFLWKITPSVMIDSGDRSTWVLGLERKFDGTDSIGLAVDFWKRF